MKRQPGTLALPCPCCGVRPVETAKKVWVLRGFLIFARYGEGVLIGCEQCVNEQVQKQLLGNALFGWWSVPWGLATPFVLVQNLLALYRPPSASQETLAEALRNNGVSLNDVMVGADGLTGGEKRLLQAAYWALSEAIWADGEADPSELALAGQLIESLSDGAVSEAKAKAQLLFPDMPFDMPPGLPDDYKVFLLRAAVDVVVVDANISDSELAFVERIATTLGAPSDVVEEIISALAAAANDRTAQSRDSRYIEACTVLGVAPSAGVVEMRKAYRALMFKYHPDRAATNPNLQKEYMRRSVELNSAYDYLTKRSAVAVDA